MKGFCDILDKERDIRLSQIEKRIISLNYPIYHLESTYSHENPELYFQRDTPNHFNEDGSIVINVLREYYKNEDIDFASVVDYISERRYDIAKLSGSQDADYFGVNRFHSNDLTLSTPFLSKNRFRDLVTNLIKTLDKAENKKTLKLDKDSVFARAKYGGIDNYEIQTQYPELDECSTSLILKIKDDEIIESSFTDYLDVNPKAYVSFYQKLLNDVNNDVNNLPVLHWYMARLTPILRGGGTLAEWICLPFILNNYSFEKWKVEVWSKAAIYSLSHFKSKYLTYF